MSIIVTEYVSGLFDLDLRCCTLHTQICGAEPFTPRFVVLHRFCNADETSKMSATAEMPQATNVIDRLSYDGFCARFESAALVIAATPSLLECVSLLLAAQADSDIIRYAYPNRATPHTAGIKAKSGAVAQALLALRDPPGPSRI